MAEADGICEATQAQSGQGDHDQGVTDQRTVSEGHELPFRCVEHPTREQWLEWRQNKIGASDMGGIMGVSPFVSRFDLLQIKLGMKKTRDNPAMAQGRQLEDSVLNMVKTRLKDKELMSVTCESVAHPWMVAQLDGFSFHNQVEIKCPMSPKLLMQIEAGGIPLHYLYQLQAQMLVTGRQKSIFCVYYAQILRLFEVPADTQVQNQLLDASRLFLEDLSLARSRSAR
jgi:putative phage-type endonuclease